MDSGVGRHCMRQAWCSCRAASARLHAVIVREKAVSGEVLCIVPCRDAVGGVGSAESKRRSELRNGVPAGAKLGRWAAIDLTFDNFRESVRPDIVRTACTTRASGCVAFAAGVQFILQWRREPPAEIGLCKGRLRSCRSLDRTSPPIFGKLGFRPMTNRVVVDHLVDLEKASFQSNFINNICNISTSSPGRMPDFVRPCRSACF